MPCWSVVQFACAPFLIAVRFETDLCNMSKMNAIRMAWLSVRDYYHHENHWRFGSWFATNVILAWDFMLTLDADLLGRLVWFIYFVKRACLFNWISMERVWYWPWKIDRWRLFSVWLCSLKFNSGFLYWLIILFLIWNGNHEWWSRAFIWGGHQRDLHFVIGCLNNIQQQLNVFINHGSASQSFPTITASVGI